MPLTPREAFKVGALARMVEEGLGPEAMLARVKSATAGQALGGLANLGSSALDLAGKGIGWGFKGGIIGGAGLLAAPLVAGGVAGNQLARGMDISDQDIDDIKDRELMAEYARQTEKLNRQRAIRDYQTAQQRPRRI